MEYLENDLTVLVLVTKIYVAYLNDVSVYDSIISVL